MIKDVTGRKLSAEPCAKELETSPAAVKKALGRQLTGRKSDFVKAGCA